MRKILYLFCLLILWGCTHKSSIKYDETGFYVLVEEDGYISLEPRIQPFIEGSGIDEAYHRGMVPDKETAIKIAESIWYPIYGSEIYTELPFEAILEGDSVWFVRGNLPKGIQGGCAEIRIRKKDSSILYVAHQR